MSFAVAAAAQVQTIGVQQQQGAEQVIAWRCPKGEGPMFSVLMLKQVLMIANEVQSSTNLIRLSGL